MRPRTKTLTTLALAALASLTFAQQPPVPTIQVYSRETVVDVVVTDAKGQAVHNLQQSDFTVEEDGKPQSLHSFRETSREAPATTTAAVIAARPKLPPNVYTNIQPPPAAGAVNIILLDSLNVETTDQMYAHQQAAKYLKAMPPGTQVAIFSLGGGLRILQGFSSDRVTLNAALNDMKNSFLSPASAIVPCTRPKLTLDAMRQISAFVADIKGRKNLLWFVAGGLPLYDPCEPDLQRKAFDMLAAAQVAIYPIDARGVFNDPTNSAANHLDTINVNTGAAVATASMLGFQRFTALNQLAMTALAEATGGHAYFNTNDIKTAIAAAINNGANYYTLSYVPPGLKDDGNYHDITVTVDRPSLQLSYRRGYGADDITKIAATSGINTKLAATTPAPDANTMSASMARFAPPATQLLFDVKIASTATAPKPTNPKVMGVLDPKLKDKPLTRYDILYFLPATQITFADTADHTHSASVEFDIVASDVFGNVISSKSQTMDLPLTQDEYQQFLKTPFQFFQQLDLPPGQTFLRVGILDKTSNKIGTLEIPLTVAKSPTAAVSNP